MSAIKELTIISGKGGTGKTSLAGSFAALSQDAVFVDSDVDAANLRLILHARELVSHEFRASEKAVIHEEKCNSCGLCEELCRFEGISKEPHRVNHIYCEGCGVCYHACPEKAISMEEVVSGNWFISETPYGKLVHARLGIAEGNSGKLVTLLRKEAAAIAVAEKKELIVIDGPPGIGCPVISSLSGVSAALIVTEPTVSGIQDMSRILEVCQRFNINTMVCINRFDLDTENTLSIEKFCLERSIPLIGKIPFSREVNLALINKTTIVEYSDNEVSQIIKEIWTTIKGLI